MGELTISLSLIGRHLKMLKIDDRIDNRYRITGRLGQGGMAEVYEASDFISKKPVAIKIIKEQLCQDKNQLDRFNNESKLCAIMSHPNIIRVYSCGEYEGRPYLAYEYMKGQTLNECLRNSLMFSLKEACYIMLQLCDALYYIHNHNVIHRDIKPDNIFYNTNGTIKIADFGIAYDLQNPSKKSEVVGSVYYMAPELCKGEAPTIQSDIYSLGITFFELVTGQLPFVEKDANEIAKAHLKKPLPSVHTFNPELNKNVDYVIEKACAKNKENRYVDCMEFKKDIQALLDNKDNFVQKRNIFKRVFGLK